MNTMKHMWKSDPAPNEAPIEIVVEAEEAVEAPAVEETVEDAPAETPEVVAEAPEAPAEADVAPEATEVEAAAEEALEALEEAAADGGISKDEEAQVAEKIEQTKPKRSRTKKSE